MATHSSTLKNKQKKRHMSCKEKKVMEKKKIQRSPNDCHPRADSEANSKNETEG